MTSNREMPGPLGGGYSGQIIGAVVKALDIDHNRRAVVSRRRRGRRGRGAVFGGGDAGGRKVVQGRKGAMPGHRPVARSLAHFRHSDTI